MSPEDVLNECWKYHEAAAERTFHWRGSQHSIALDDFSPSLVWFFPVSGRRPSHLPSCCITRRASPGMETYSRQGPQRSYTTDSSRVFRPFSVQHSFSYDFLKSCSHSGHRVPPTSPVRKGTWWRPGQYPHRFRTGHSPSSAHPYNGWCPQGQREATTLLFCATWSSLWSKPKRFLHGFLPIHSLQLGRGDEPTALF